MGFVRGESVKSLAPIFLGSTALCTNLWQKDTFHQAELPVILLAEVVRHNTLQVIRGRLQRILTSTIRSRLLMFSNEE
jgi:hypothetical protein